MKNHFYYKSLESRKSLGEKSILLKNAVSAALISSVLNNIPSLETRFPKQRDSHGGIPRLPYVDLPEEFRSFLMETSSSIFLRAIEKATNAIDLLPDPLFSDSRLIKNASEHSSNLHDSLPQTATMLQPTIEFMVIIHGDLLIPGDHKISSRDMVIHWDTSRKIQMKPTSRENLILSYYLYTFISSSNHERIAFA